MNIKSILKKMLTETSVFFTLIAALYSLLMLIVNVGEEEVLLSAERLLLMFVFSALAAMAQALRRITAIHGALRGVLHYLILIMAFYLCFLLPASMRAAQVLIGLFTFTLGYLAIMGIVALFRARFRKNSEEEEDYTNRFKQSR
ncbi:MAG: hypothetical protein IKA44_05610 [Clostridia bacterium]|nr:hypothetical protein [Clostridia bacterium]